MDDLTANMYGLMKNNIATLKVRVTRELGDIVTYLTETDQLIRQYGTFKVSTSTLEIKSIINSNFGTDDFPFHNANF